MRKMFVIAAALALVLAACGGSSPDSDGSGTTAPVSSGEASHGEEIFGATCAACHGADAKGIEGLGKNLHNNEFVDGKSDDEMVAFLKEGRLADDPLNTTGVAMPPKGGNPALSDDDLNDVVAYLRTLN